MRKIARIAIGALAFIAGACGGSGTGPDSASPEAAFRRQVDFLAQGQTSRAYRELHPAQQEFIPEALYQQCASEAGGVKIASLKVKEVYDEKMTIPGTDVVVDAKAITAEIEIERGLLKNKATNTYHEILVDGSWRFTVSGADDYRKGRCP